MRLISAIAGAIGAAVGLPWLGQGAGCPDPRSSPVTDQSPWAYRGIGAMGSGVAAMVVSRPVRRF